VTLAPRVGSASGIDHESRVLGALDLDDRLKLITRGGILHTLWAVASFKVAKTKLPIHIETPSKEDSLVCQCGNMAEASCTLNEVLPLIRVYLDLLWQLKESLVLSPELPESGLSPAPNVTLFCDSQREERAAGYVVNRLSVEGLDVLRC
jgi:hypothetical protein